MGKEELRASDADRQQIADQLRNAMDKGRLSLHEYDDRLQQAYASKTYGELAPLVSDLPAERGKPGQLETPRRIPQWVVIMWIPWAAVNLLMLVIWAATGAGYFWPFWLAVPWGIALLIPTGIGIITGTPPKKHS
ncbi:DUF1707 domain-containing protein [Nocardia sp. XZ_19_385]|uniref:DUF1707 domain-containing protein n=1 Tax=Nocardia sp. XZ_19_385 TaxID=2769488 RepID=UPI002814A348|nr:DUF1707 domain-containing protein [Nocardia sp. XZ_19_385]